MSEHRRKMPPQQPPTGGRAAARRAAQQPMGRRSAPAQDVGTEAPSASYGPSSPAGEEPRPYGGRAEARRAAQRGSRRKGADTGPGGPGGGRRGGGGGGGRGGGPGRGSGGPPPGRKRIIDYPRHGKYGWRRWMPSWKLVTGTFLVGFGVLLGGSVFAYYNVVIPKEDVEATSQNNIYYWADDTRMVATGSGANRQIIGIEDIPKVMQEAVISAENKTFWDDSGIDPKGIGRAVWNMAKGGDTQGGSTITQQYVKNNRLNDQSQTVTRKVKELFISMKVGNELEKSDIMAGYLNTAYYGRGAYGIQAAARAYFDKDAEELNVSESALLAAVLKGATYYDPAGYPEYDARATPEKNLDRATKRWKWILNEMVKDKKISAEERAKYTTFPKVQKRKQDAQLTGQIGYLVSTAKANFINNNDRGYGAKELERGGFEIHTTFEKPKVQALEKSVTKILDEYIDPKKRPKTDTNVQFGGASVDVKTGAIVAIYGGVDATKHFTNNADTTGAQVGSTFKPFVLAAAMKYGVRDPKLGNVQDASSRTLVNPDKSRYSGKDKLQVRRYNGDVWHNEKGDEWRQTNDDGASYGDMTLREAMIRSANSPYVQLGMDVGIDKVREASISAGLRKDSLVQGEVPSFSLGISSPSAIRMAGTYATFANSGEQNDPFSVRKVRKGGEEIYTHKAKSNEAFSPAIASNVTDILRDVVEDPKGTGRKAAIPGRDVAGKTGTTDGNKSAWFVGYTAQLSTAIDMYRFDDDETKKNREFEEMYGTGDQPKIHGSSFPSRIWKDYMTTAVEKMPKVKFPEPMDLDNAEPVYGGGATSPTPSPTPTPTPTDSETPTTTPPATATTTPPATKTPKPGKTTCGVWDWECNNPGNPGGNTGQPTTTPPPETESPTPTDTPTDGNGPGNGSGGPGRPGDGSWIP
ncbi:transglycosylase domain-containing protein [Streptomyces sp. NPDC059247]|uniref:transglycosylase domain-containing protein n=1 Tax=Streptomyces sp. NPDC059247 TaxID=3346790 RepID=UPI0036D1BFB9